MANTNASVVYPDWAPQELRALHQRQIAGAGDFESPTRALLTKDGMKDVWTWLADQSPQFPNIPEDSRRSNELGFLSAVIAAWRGPSKDWDNQPDTKRRARVNKISKLCLALAKELDGGFDISWSGLLALPSLEQSDFEHLARGFTPWVRGAFENKPGGLPEINADAVRNLHSWMYVQEAAPRLAYFLEHLAKHATDKGAIPSPVPRPGAGDVKRNYFVRSLAAFVRGRYGKPHLKLVVLTTRVLFDAEIETADVAKIIGSPRNKQSLKATKNIKLRESSKGKRRAT